MRALRAPAHSVSAPCARLVGDDAGVDEDDADADAVAERGHVAAGAPRPRRSGAEPAPGAASTSDGLPSALAALCAELAALPDEQARFLRLVALGEEALPQLPEAERSRHTRVRGCASITHIHVRTADDHGVRRVASVRGASDARISAGLVALLACGLTGATAEEVRALTLAQVLSAAEISGALAPSRANGSASVLHSIQTQVERGAQTPEHGATLPGADEGAAAADIDTVLANRWSDRQPQEDVAVLLSGGVDSSVAMHELLEQGYRPQPFYLKIWLEDELAHLNECPWEEDVAYATAVCEAASRRFGRKVELESLPLQREYHERIVRYAIDEARCGRTPNPDVMCNSRVKFGAFLSAISDDFAYVATGHYARTATRAAPDGAWARLLMRAADEHKDQTYFLSHLSQAQVRRALFPIGHLTKAQVRARAASAELDLPNQDRRDSQGLCFLGKLKFDDFLAHYLGERTGAIIDWDSGALLGRHRGFWFHTLGQRRGLGLPDGPWYVVHKDPGTNRVYVSRRYMDADKPRDAFDVGNLRWIAGSEPVLRGPVDGARLEIKVRHGAETHLGRLTIDADGRGDRARGRVELVTRDKGLAPGQFAAFYDGQYCLGSGVIDGVASVDDAWARGVASTRDAASPVVTR